MMATKISTYATDDSVGTLSEIQSHWFGLRWLEGRCETSNAEVVAGDLFATQPSMSFVSVKSGLMRIAFNLFSKSAASSGLK